MAYHHNRRCMLRSAAGLVAAGAVAVPGKDVEVTLTPNKAGRFAWVCDNFCGEGHDEMSGWFIVTVA